MRRLIMPAVAVCLLAPAAAVEAAKPAPKPPKAPAKLTLSATPARVTYGRATTLSGKLTGGRKAAGETIMVQADAYPIDGHYVDMTTAVTDANGDWHASQQPTVLTRYRARAKTSPPVTSATTDVGVGVRVRVSIHVSDRTPARGKRVRFHGTITPAHDGRPVRIQRRTRPGHWKTVGRTASRTTGSGFSTYTKRVRIRRSGTYRVRALSGDADHLRGTSHRRRLTVGG